MLKKDRSLSYTTHKNEPKMDSRLECNSWNHKTFGNKQRKSLLDISFVNEFMDITLTYVLSCFSHVWLCAMDWSLQGSSVHGILQARILEWVAVSFSRGSSRARDWTCVSWFLTTEPPEKPGCLVVWINSVPTEMKIEHLVIISIDFCFFILCGFF